MSAHEPKGAKVRSGERSRRTAANTDDLGKIRTSGGLLQKTIYFHPEEWAALRDEAHEAGASVTAGGIVRALVREHYGMDPLEARRGPKGRA